MGKKRQTKGTNSESKQNSGILRYGSSIERGSLNSSSGGTTIAVSYLKPLSAKLPPESETAPHPGWQDGTILEPASEVAQNLSLIHI